MTENQNWLYTGHLAFCKSVLTVRIKMMIMKVSNWCYYSCCGEGPAYLLCSLWRRSPGGLLHLAAERDRLLGHRAVLPLLGGGGWDRGWGRGGGGWGRRGGRGPGPEDGHLLCGCETQAAQTFMCLRVHHQQPGLIVQGFDQLYHLRDGTGW